MRRSVLLCLCLTATLGGAPARADDPSVILSASSTSVPPRGVVVIAASGGVGGVYEWEIVNNRAGSTITQDGEYTAGSTGNVSDRIRASDGHGNAAEVTIAIGPGLSIPSGNDTTPRGTLTLTAAGGSGQINTWTVETNNSGATITSAGVYTAGPEGDVSDVVRVTDSLGNVATTTVSVGPSLSIDEPTVAVSPHATIQLTAHGGSGTVASWELTSNQSGGSIDAEGVYTVGPQGSVEDVVEVTDTLGNTASLVLELGRGVTVRTVSVDVPPRGTTVLTPFGGSGTGYRFSLLANQSGGFITSDGVYTAGVTPNTRDTVRVTDSLNNLATVYLLVGPGVTIRAPTGEVTPGAAMMMTAVGGSGTGFAWSPVEMGSGGTITLAGLYTPGAQGNSTDTIAVVDSVGNRATLTMTISGGITITGARPVAPRQSIALTASGGSGLGFQWKFAANGSAGKLENPTGEFGPTVNYTAGPYPSTKDTVQVTDSFGNSITIDITVGAGIQIEPSTLDPQRHNTFTVEPGGQQLFQASGGQGSGYVWTLLRNRSGATLSEDGLYQAGAEKTEVKDTLQVVDPLGNSATIVVAVLGDVPQPPAAAPTTSDAGGCTSTGASGSTAMALLAACALLGRRERRRRPGAAFVGGAPN